MAVYGANGAGKSCFVDAIEYVLRGGRIEHLAHEYSGKHQEKAVLNTHMPADAEGAVALVFADGTSVLITITPKGTYTTEGDGVHHLTNWDARRTVLRQDEVSHFVHSTKGEKYSVLLPLLGLGHLETTAENLRQLSAAVARLSGIRDALATLKAATGTLESAYGDSAPTQAGAALRDLCGKHVTETRSGHVRDAS